MDIFLLPSKKGHYRLFSPEFREIQKPAAESSPESATGNSLLSTLKAGYQAITGKERNREKILKRVAKSEGLQLYYPGHLTEETAGNIYQDLVEKAVKKHRRWLIVDGVLLPFSALFSVIPGPNLLLAYLAWRTVAHYKTQKGGKKALADPRIIFIAEPQLERLETLLNKRFALNRKHKIRRIGETLEIERLDELY